MLPDHGAAGRVEFGDVPGPIRKIYGIGNGVDGRSRGDIIGDREYPLRNKRWDIEDIEDGFGSPKPGILHVRTGERPAG